MHIPGRFTLATAPRRQRFQAAGLVGAISVLAAFTGCTGLREWAQQGYKVGPDYWRPPAPVAEDWIDYENPDVDTTTSPDGNWWSAAFGDPALDRLIALASQQNLTLQTAGMRILAARARLNIARGNVFPQIQQAFGDYVRVNGSQNTANVFPIADFDTWDTGLSATWELDFWGRFRRAIEAEDAFLNAEIENYDNVLVILQAEVATAYIQYRTLQERLRLAQRNVALQQRTLEIADVRARNELVTELDVAQAKENLAATQSFIPDLESGIRQTGNAICVLLGIPPQDLTEELGEGPIPDTPGQIWVGIPAELVRRRPDVRRAERLAAAQSALIGVAESDFYPRIAISGFIGAESEHLDDLFTAASFAGSVGPGFRWDILNYGRILNNVRGNEAEFYRLVYDYQNTVLQAAQEVEDGIVSFLKERERVARLNESATQAQRSVDISTTQYQRGSINFQPVVYMQQILASRQDELAASRGAVAANLVSVYKALGGGWQARFGAVSAPPGVPLEMEEEAAVEEDREEVETPPLLEAPAPPPPLQE